MAKMIIQIAAELKIPKCKHHHLLITNVAAIIEYISVFCESLLFSEEEMRETGR